MGEKLVLTIMAVGGIALLVLFAFSADECMNDGGELVQTHTLLMPVWIGNIVVMQQVPQYECVIKKKSNN